MWKIQKIVAIVHRPCNLISFRVSDAKCKLIVVTAGCVSVCLSPAAFPHYSTDLGVSWGMVGVPSSCAQLGGFAIGARVSLL